MLSLLLFVLTRASLPTIKSYGLSFVTTSDWKPNEREVIVRDENGKARRDQDGEILRRTEPPAFGALPVIYGTAVSSVIALVLAVPFSFGAAIFLVRMAPKFLVPPVSFLIEFLAAIPSIAYGVWGLFVLTPFLQYHFEPFLKNTLGHVPGTSWLFFRTLENGSVAPVPLTGRDMLAGGLILSIMIIPIITAISRDVLRNVPSQQIEGSIALGATWWQSVVEMLRFSRSALFGAVMLGLARAAGETMAVAMVIGNANRISASLFDPAQTMSSLLANQFGEASGEQFISALSAIALILLVMSLLFNVVARWLVVGKNSRTAAAH